MKKIKYLICFAIFLSPSVYADPFSYNYLFASMHLQSGGDSFGINQTSIGGSLSPLENISFVAGYNYSSPNIVSESDEIVLGVNVYAPIVKKLDILFGISLINAQTINQVSSTEDTGNEIRVIANIKVSRKFNLDVGVARIDLFDTTTNRIDATGYL